MSEFYPRLVKNYPHLYFAYQRAGTDYHRYIRNPEDDDCPCLDKDPNNFEQCDWHYVYPTSGNIIWLCEYDYLQWANHNKHPDVNSVYSWIQNGFALEHFFDESTDVLKRVDEWTPELIDNIDAANFPKIGTLYKGWKNGESAKERSKKERAQRLKNLAKPPVVKKKRARSPPKHVDKTPPKPVEKTYHTFKIDKTKPPPNLNKNKKTFYTFKIDKTKLPNFNKKILHAQNMPPPTLVQDDDSQ